MVDKEKILTALAQLDPLDDDQWTTDGSPKVETVSGLIGETVKRQDIVNAAPDFNREKASTVEDNEDFSDVVKENDSNEDVEISSENTFSEMSGDEVLKPEMSPSEFQSWLLTVAKEGLEEIESSLKKQNDEVGQEIKKLQDLQKRITTVITMTRNRIKEAFPNSVDAHAIRSFIESQTAARAARVERRQTILKGIRPDELDYRAPIDAAMARKTKRGAQRPVRPLVK